VRTKLSVGIGAAAAAIVVTAAAGAASAASGAHQQSAGPALAAASVSRHITKAQAQRIAEAKVPHSRAIEIQSDDLHDRAVWKVTLATPHGRVVVDVDKRTGKATVVRRGGSGGGHDDAIVATRLGASSGAAGRSAGTGAVTERSRDARGHDGAREDHAGRHDHGGRHDHDRGDDNPGR